MTALEAVVREPSRPDAGRRLVLARIFLTPLCAAAIAIAAARDLLASLLGESLIPRIQLHMQFNSLSFLLIFLPCTLVLYALYRRTAAANWFLTAAGLFFYATAGVIYLVPLLFTCVLDYAVGSRRNSPACAPRSAERRPRLPPGHGVRRHLSFASVVGARAASRGCVLRDRIL